MPEQNQPIQGNFGGIFSTATPNLDRVSQQLMAQYADRKAYLQKESETTDNLLNKEMANVRSADTSDIFDAYNEYKSSKQNQLFNKSLQQNPKLYAQAQMDSNAKYAKVMSMINKSAQYNALGKQFAANRFAKPDQYADDAGDKLSTFYRTPMDQLTNADYKGAKVDLTNPDNWRFQGGNFDFSKLHTTAVGKPVTHYDNGTTDQSGVQTTQHGYQFGNTPSTYRNTFLGGLAGNEAGRAARYKWSQHPQEELDQLDAAYQNSPNWQKMGVTPQTLPSYNPNDPVGNEATYQAKQYLVGMNPAEVKASTATNQAAKIGLQAKTKLQGQEVMESMREGNRERLADIRHDYKQMDIKQQSTVLDDTYDAIVDDAKKSGQYIYKSADGKVSKQYEVKASPALKKEFSVPDDKGHPIYPDAFRMSEDGKTVTPIFFQPDQTGNNKAINTSVSKPMTSIEFKARLGKTLFGVREAAKEAITPASGKKDIHGW